MRGNLGLSATAPRTSAPTEPPAASIRFTPHMDIRASREALTFAPIERVLRTGQEIIRVGRYSERDNGPTARDPSGINTAPVGFKSKVVSRRHCEFWYDNGQWYVKDVKSSSGTFLNHIRLSAPGAESKAFPLYDGDVLQLGIDFKGGEEPIFRCVKIRVELNRAWQKGLNNFNMSAHKRIRNMAASSRPQGDTSSLHTSECSICLMSVAPCQALFVAPCSHVWHFKCIRPLVLKSYPVFLCPNCRAIADLDRDIEDDELEMYNTTNATDGDGKSEHSSANNETHVGHNTRHHDHDDDAGDDDPEDGGAAGTGEEGIEGISQQQSHRNRIQQADNDSIDSRSSGDNGYVRGRDNVDSDDSGSGSGRRTGGVSRGPMTPRNDIGPFVFDGAASRRGRGSEEALVEL
ncbi:hypothetical protein L211DRAFT_776311 [Terfezia boudieri ATCC MYA-4762]|uniref:RING-type E3 ubiquitin transferase n=1 Tax=Terfezia boudieri ATCC MYA-4762 TaxID=1051890 RepID=A0A3N4M3J7_9PEZI|nr:hypothetical protein L211DRAFT_776311 [Terfezia boudieri ATCC MYA-4762]